MIRPSAIDLAGVRYMLTEDGEGFRMVWESSITRRRVEAGGERGEREVPRTDILVWRWDDWSLGEGQRFIDTRRQNTFFKYLTSNGAVDIRIPGQIRLGMALSSSRTLGTVTNRPRLGVTNRVWVVYDQSAYELVSGTWTSRTTGLTANVAGPIDTAGNKVFVASSAGLRRIGSAANAAWHNNQCNTVVINNSRVFNLDDNSESVDLERTPLQPLSSAPFTPSIRATIDGVDNDYAMCSDGVNLFIVVGDTDTRPFLHKFTAGDEAAPQFADIPTGFAMAHQKTEAMKMLNGVLFLGGYFKDPHTNVDQATLLWFTDQSSGIVGRMTERTDDERITSVYPSYDNQLLMGTTKGNVYAYNMDTGGFYEFASGLASTETISSITFKGGQFFVAIQDSSSSAGIVYATLTSGTGKYPSSVKVEGSEWDFDVPLEDKALLEVIVNGTFPANTSAEFSFVADGGSEVTTDAVGATMVANTTGDTTFTISDFDTEQVFKRLKPIITLKTSDTSVTPRINSVSMRVTTTTKVKFIEATVDLRQPAANARVPERAVTGAKAFAEIEALLDSSSDRILVCKPYFEKARAPHTRTTDSYSVILDEASLEWSDPGRGLAKLRMRVLG